MNGELTKIEDIAPIVMFLATAGWWITVQVSLALNMLTIDYLCQWWIYNPLSAD